MLIKKSRAPCVGQQGSDAQKRVRISVFIRYFHTLCYDF